MHRMVKDISILDHSYIPENLPGRENELRELRSNLRFCEQIPKFINLQGKSGTGKTATVNKICNEVTNELSDAGVKIKYVHIDCSSEYTKFLIFKRICNEICENKKLPNTTHDLRKRFYQEINGKDTYESLILFLDEIDSVARQGPNEIEILKELSRLKPNKKTKCNVSVIIATNRTDFYSTLDESLRSSFRAKPLIYHAYDSDTLGAILKERVDKALYEGVLDDDVIPFCSALAAQEHGDARKAIDLLRTAIEVALDKNSDIVKKEHIKSARTRIEEDQTYKIISKLPLQQKLVLFSVYRLLWKKRKAKQEAKTQTGELQEEYEKICKKMYLEPCTSRWVREKLGDLDTLGLIRLNLTSFGRFGRTNIITTQMPLDILEETFKTDENTFSFFEEEPAPSLSLDSFGITA